MFVVSAILEADKRHCRAANNRSLDLGPLAGAELGLISCPSDEMDKADEGPDFSWSSDTAGDRDLTAEDPEHSDDFKSAMTEVEDSVGPRWAAAERRAETRIRPLLRIAQLTNVNDRELSCLHTISDSVLIV